MFARTPRLLLRPGFAEDAAALAALVADERRLRLATAGALPELDRAETMLADAQGAALPMLLITERTGDAVQLVGACGLTRRSSGRIELMIWIGRAHGGRGLAGEACAALIDIARTLGLGRIDARCIDGDVAGQRLLARLGFVTIGISSPVDRCGGDPVSAHEMRLVLAGHAPATQLAA